MCKSVVGHAVIAFNYSGKGRVYALARSMCCFLEQGALYVSNSNNSPENECQHCWGNNLQLTGILHWRIQSDPSDANES